MGLEKCNVIEVETERERELGRWKLAPQIDQFI